MREKFLLGLPGLRQLWGYDRSWWGGDLLAGITVAAYLIPQCMAYGEIVGVSPVVGLWTILPAMCVYALVGSSRQLSVGPESTTAVMTAAAIAPLLLADGSNYGVLTATLAMLVGAICLVGYVARVGFLANLLSKPILVGYMAGVAIVMIAGQLGKISGISIQGNTVLTQVSQFVQQIFGASSEGNRLHLPTLILAGLTFGFLVAIGKFFPKAPAPLLAVLISTVAVAIFDLDRQGLAIVGAIEAGLPQVVIPHLSAQLPDLLASALGIAIVGYSDNVLTARSFAARHQQKIDANQELLALGLANVGAGLVQGFPVSSSGSRTAIADTSGSKTQLYSLVAMGVVMAVLIWLRPVLALFPKAALGALVIFAAFRLIEISEFVRLYRFRRSEFCLAMITTVGVLTTDISVGVAIAVGLSVVELLSRLARPHDAVQGMVPNLPGFHDIDDWEGATTIPGLVIYRYDAPLCFANAEDFKSRALRAIESEIAPVEWFVLNTEAIVEVDITAMDILEELYDELAARQITLAMARVKQDLYAQLQRSALLEKIGKDRIYFTLSTMIVDFKNLKVESDASP
ncbi:SulP family inorganic anion transporter [Chamaesiphon sp.]|uniref:SulP family inorganic anion transporter n=1 Tax=Chamaesiphon sp. TaxID=2814140 RepID=UPI0035940FB4